MNAVSIDWLRATTRQPGVAWQFAEIFGGTRKEATLKAIPRFDASASFENVRVDYSSTIPGQVVMVTMTGEHLRSFAGTGGEIGEVMRYIRNNKMHVTRVDAALDIPASVDIKAFFDDFSDGKFSSHVTAGHFIRGSGDTAYIGSRTSARMLRVYDKRAEARGGEGDAWTRVELEMKDKMANAFVEACTIHGMIPCTLRAMVDFLPYTGHKWFDDAVRSDDTEIDMTMGRKTTDSDKWLREVAVPAVIRALIANDRETYNRLSKFFGLQSSGVFKPREVN